ncbi:MAG: hypothetical protein ACI4EJ_10205 [Bacteroides sp.]
MKKYMRPEVAISEDINEGVFAASGDAQGHPKCESKYMNGVFKNTNYTSSDGTVKETFGCLGCNCYRGAGYCGLEEYQYGSYDEDNGKRKPGWEQEGKQPHDRAW